jgi:hypothetical protein
MENNKNIIIRLYASLHSYLIFFKAKQFRVYICFHRSRSEDPGWGLCGSNVY